MVLYALLLAFSLLLLLVLCMILRDRDRQMATSRESGHVKAKTIAALGETITALCEECEDAIAVERQLKEDLQGLEDNLITELRKRDEMERAEEGLLDQLDSERELVALERRKRGSLEGRLREAAREVELLSEENESLTEANTQWRKARAGQVERANRLEREKSVLEGTARASLADRDRVKECWAALVQQRDKLWEERDILKHLLEIPALGCCGGWTDDGGASYRHKKQCSLYRETDLEVVERERDELKLALKRDLGLLTIQEESPKDPPPLEVHRYQANYGSSVGGSADLGYCGTITDTPACEDVVRDRWGGGSYNFVGGVVGGGGMMRASLFLAGPSKSITA